MSPALLGTIISSYRMCTVGSQVVADHELMMVLAVEAETSSSSADRPGMTHVRHGEGERRALQVCRDVQRGQLQPQLRRRGGRRHLDLVDVRHACTRQRTVRSVGAERQRVSG